MNAPPITRRAVLATALTASLASRVRAEELRQLKVAVSSTSFAMGSVRIAMEAGLFAKRGVQLNIVVMDSGSATMAALLSHSADLVIAGTGELLAARTHGVANRAQYAVWGWRELPVPVIAAVHGVAFGGGFQLMLGADMRYIAPDTKLSIMEIKWGLVPDMAGTQLMRHIVREDIVRELSYTGRIFSGEEAGKLGFATRVVADPRAEALAVAREIAGKNPAAIRAAKRIYNDAVYQDAEAGLTAESVEQIRLIGSANQVEAVMANLQKRDPVFTD